jgi:hypothetical protein
MIYGLYLPIYQPQSPYTLDFATVVAIFDTIGDLVGCIDVCT